MKEKMSIQNSSTIDFVSLDEIGNIILTISDHLEWDEKGEHCLLLQNKINHYLEFIESGQLYDYYPEFKGRRIKIEVVTKFLANELGRTFLSNVKNNLENSGYTFAIRMIDNN